MALLAKGLSNGVEHMRGCKIANNSTSPAAVLVQVVVKHNEDLVCVDILAVFVDDTETVAVSVKRDTEIVILADNALGKVGKLSFTGGGHISAEIRVLV